MLLNNHVHSLSCFSDWLVTTLTMKFMRGCNHNSTRTGPSTGHTNLLFWTECKIQPWTLKGVRKKVGDIQLAKILPDRNVQTRLVRNWAVIVSRVITKYLPPFQSFQDVVFRHIPHKYSKEMSQKSNSVSLPGSKLNFL